MFSPQCLPVLIGSLPVEDHLQAIRTVLSYTPDIPLWPQLPKHPGEGMIRQFLSNFPGLTEEGKKFWIDTGKPSFTEEMTLFYEDYIRCQEDTSFLGDSKFGLGSDTAPGFELFLSHLRENGIKPLTLKGQITGPITTGIGTRDQNESSILYDENLRDILVKMLALKGAWQVLKFREYLPSISPLIFIDEPGMVSFGSSAFTGVTKEMVIEAVDEVIDAIHQAGGIAGIHICANGDWSPALSSTTNIISFDAYSFFENFILYRDQLVDYIQRGGILAWGIIPTGDPLAVESETTESLFAKWQEQLEALASFGIDKQQLMSQTLIAPACGTGSLTVELAEKVLLMTREVSEKARQLHMFS